MEKKPIAICWLRRDLRIEDHHALFKALQSGLPVLLIFIFDKNILEGLPKYDKRLIFIYQNLQKIHQKLQQYRSGLRTYYGEPKEIWQQILLDYHVKAVFTNHDYEPYAIERDKKIENLLKQSGIDFYTFKDQVICEKDEVLKEDGKPYTVYTPYSKKWKEVVKNQGIPYYPSENYLDRCLQDSDFYLHSLEEIGFIYQKLDFFSSELRTETLKKYAESRDIPSDETGTSKLSVHLRFGTVSIRKIYHQAVGVSEKFINELIWREFYMMILYHFPYVVHSCFRPEFNEVQWNHDEKLFELWCEGKTGVPIVDAGMRELNQTGYMHNRVRMIVASFLTKNLWIDWRWGEKYFAEKLLDFELASNNGSWQWVAGCGVDAAPYFRVFNPYLQTQKFDSQLLYIKKWIPELETFDYPQPIVDVQNSAKKAIEFYQRFLKK
ncbi:MAG: deoxyribodipyrimidine photo-lyase [Bacteroidia bacterium]|nr:MAG: deoxyribodipyrimidine photo-lyase [Bacteroidia bacterium]